MFAAVDDNPYNLVLLFHMLSVIVGAGASFAVPILGRRVRTALDSHRSELAASQLQVAKFLVAPGLLLGGLFGGGLVAMSDDVFDFQQTWLVIAGPVWIIQLVCAGYLVMAGPGTAGRPERERFAPMALGILHLSVIVMLYLMVWKPM